MRRAHTFSSLVLVLGVLAACPAKRPGQRWVDEISLRGARQLDDDDVLDKLATRETSWWPWADYEWYEPGKLDLDLKRIKAYYAERGFFAARVVEHKVQENDDGETVDVLLKVEEGKPTHIDAVRFEGLEPLSQELRTEVRGAVQLRRGERFDHARYLAAKQQLQAALVGDGYAYAAVDGKMAVNRDTRRAEVRLIAQPGPRVRFGETTLTGNGPLPADKLYRLVSWERGAIFHEDEIARTRARLFSQRVFSSVRIELPPRPTAEADIALAVTPAKLRELRLGGGLGVERRRHEVRLQARWTKRNFLGGLRTLTARLQPAWVSIPAIWASERSGPTVESDIKLEQPDIFATDILAFALAGYDLGLHEGYRFHGPRLQLGAERPFWDGARWGPFSNVELRVGASWNLQFLDFFDFEDNPQDTPLGLSFSQSYRLAWLEPFVRFVLRDSQIDPRAGGWIELRAEIGEQALAGQFRYLKLVPEARLYLPLGTKRLVLSARGQLGWLNPGAGQDTPVTRRLSLGGPSSHRGFSFGRLSPQIVRQDRGVYVPVGGNASVLLSGDLRLRVIKLAGNWLGLTGFVDAGDVVGELNDIDLAQLHLAVGGSLGYETPIGTIRIGVGVRLNRLVDDPIDPSGPDRVATNPDPGERIAFHLTIGSAY